MLLSHANAAYPLYLFNGLRKRNTNLAFFCLRNHQYNGQIKLLVQSFRLYLNYCKGNDRLPRLMPLINQFLD